MEFSKFGKRFTRHTGASELMDDMGAAMDGSGSMIGPMLMLGGGNPARIPAVEQIFKDQLAAVIDQPDEFSRMVGNYSRPAGEGRFRRALARLLHNQYGWDLSENNIALTSGSQNAFFILFNLLAGDMERTGTHKQILLPMAPEYIGYCDVGVSENMFHASRPTIEYLDHRLFKYHVDFDAIDVSENIGAVCVSRPTNPTGNVLTDDEINKLLGLAEASDVPLIIDNAYGTPFPHIIFTEVKPLWNENIILCMSLSKIGLPGIRTGIVIAREEIISAVSSMNAVMHLSVSSVGAVLLHKLVASGEIINISHNIITPFYRSRVEHALVCVRSEFEGIEYRIHVPEGALFLWLWFPDLPITSAELYSRLKRRGVLVLSGHHFFPGLKEDWRHKNECLRMTYSQDPATVAAGIRIIAEEVRRAWD
ncbi:MAG: valine--pyruvate transaminase [Proteobacteria bacterium]|nr:valine--pyruvate transaminase [Pseudomonadota bacterium]